MNRPASPPTLGATLLKQRLDATTTAAPSAFARNLVIAPTTDPNAPPDVPLPPYVANALARWRLLYDLPFRYLVPDAGLLPPESMRFFAIDDAWLDALSDGALLAGGRGSRETARAQAVQAQARALGLAGMAGVRDVVRGRAVVGLPGLPQPVGTGSTPRTTGLLMRSQLVANWPGMKVRAWTSADTADIPPGADDAALEAAHPEFVVPLLRLECLNPSVMIAIFAGEPRMLWLEEPHHAVQFGVDRAITGALSIQLRDSNGAPANRTQAVSLRAGAVPGVVDIAALAQGIDAALPLNAARGSAALAVQLLQAPARQRFGQ